MKRYLISTKKANGGVLYVKINGIKYKVSGDLVRTKK